MDSRGGRAAIGANGRFSRVPAAGLVLAVAAVLGLVLALGSSAVVLAQEDNASLLIRKVDEAGNRLEGAIFEIEGMEGEFETNAEGEFCLTGLPNDSVWAVTEVQAPPGFEPADPATQMVEVDDDGDCDSPDAVFVNTVAQEDNASLLIRKVDEAGNRLEGAIFEIEGMEGEFETNAEGEFCLTGLPNDSVWAVTEVQAPPGFEPADPATQMVEVDDDGDCDSPDAVFVNTVAQPEVGSLLILKTDNEGAPLAGAIFEIEGQAGPITTTDTGVICLDNLTLGDTVTVTETQAPTGFLVATPASRDVTVTSTATCLERAATDADETFVNALQQVSVGSPSPRQTPRQVVAGGTPRARVLPSTAMPADSAPLTGVLGVVLVASLAGVAVLSYRRVRSDD